MPKSLPSTWQLISDSWKLYLSTWNESLKVSIWFLYYGLVYFAVYVSIKFVPAMIYIGILASIGILIFWSWTIIRLLESCLRLNDGKKVDDSKEAMNRSWTMVAPLLWVGVLQVLVLLASCIPLVAWSVIDSLYLSHTISVVVFNLIALVLILPFIYVCVRLGFSQLVAIDQGKRGIEALAVSSEMVSDRWWEVFVRQFGGVVVFGIGLWVMISLLFLVLAFIVGPEKFIILSDPNVQDPMLLGIEALLEGIVQAAVMPLLLIFVVKLYRAFQRSK